MTPIQSQQELQDEGVISAHPKGFGFIRLQGTDDLFVPPPFMKSLVPGDRVKFHREVNPRSGQLFAAIDGVIERPESFWLGELEQGGGQQWLRSDDALTPGIRVHGAAGVKSGDVVQVRLRANAQVGATTLDAQFVQNLGPRDVADFDVRYAIAKWRLPDSFAEGELAEAAAFAEPTLDYALAKGYRDLTALPLVTIDGESTKDFDDAVCLQRGDGFTLWVAIADVSHYVQPGTALDACAMLRGTSVYLPDRVLPMLPPTLSTGLCSLNPGALRLAVVCELAYDEAGNRQGFQFYRAAIRSHARLTYAQVATDDYVGCSTEVAGMVAELKGWFAMQVPSRKERGLMEYRNLEPKLAIQENGDYGIEWLAPLESHALVEECMLAANRAAAETLGLRSNGRVFRHQDGLDPERWLEVAQWLEATAGKTGVEPTLGELQTLLGETVDQDVFAQLAFRLRRSMVPAIYDAANSSHFSLGFSAYTHFTSPIRRYADLLVHRLLLSNDYETPADVHEHLSAMSRRAKVASRYPWERMKRRLLWASQPGEMLAQVVGQSSRSCRVAVQGWDVLSVVPAAALQDVGFSWDDASQAWSANDAILGDGMLVKVKPCGLLDQGPTLELESAFIGRSA